MELDCNALTEKGDGAICVLYLKRLQKRVKQRAKQRGIIKILKNHKASDTDIIKSSYQN